MYYTKYHKNYDTVAVNCACCPNC